MLLSSINFCNTSFLYGQRALLQLFDLHTVLLARDNMKLHEKTAVANIVRSNSTQNMWKLANASRQGKSTIKKLDEGLEAVESPTNPQAEQYSRRDLAHPSLANEGYAW